MTCAGGPGGAGLVLRITLGQGNISVAIDGRVHRRIPLVRSGDGFADGGYRERGKYSLQGRFGRLNQEWIRIGALGICGSKGCLKPAVEVIARVGSGAGGNLLAIHEKLPLKTDCGVGVTLTEPDPAGEAEIEKGQR